MRTIILALLFSISLAGASQTAIKWERLDKVTFVEYFDRASNQWLLEADFDSTVTVLNHQEIKITGYVIPLDVNGEVYALSAFAFSSCFFCGGAGPETVMGLNFKNSPPKLNTDDVIKVKGTLVLNKRPGGEFHYTLNEVEILEQY